MCLACSLHCHDGHELVELYTKRHFQCDCGNKKFGDKKCKLTADKKDANTENLYNQNFVGLYCNCNRPYPDPERESPEEMIQCCICEDWFHEEHLKTTASDDEECFVDLICDSCVEEHPFLLQYAKTDVPEAKADGSCKIQETSDSKNAVALFLKQGWREKLCRCEKCLTMYIVQKVPYLIDDQDSLEYYEAKGKQGNENIEEASAKAFDRMLTHSQKVEMASGYRELSTTIRDHLKDFKGKIVEKADIQNFFSKFLGTQGDAKRQKT